MDQITNSPFVTIRSLDDPRIEVYRDLPLHSQVEDRDHFVAEGQWLVERLLESRLSVDSIFVEPNRAEDFVAKVCNDIPIYVAERDLFQQVLGFKFHRCVLACGQRPARLSIQDLQLMPEENRLIVACDRVNDPENLGGILRTCAAFGIGIVLLGPGTTDPFRRRVIRVSMGTTFGMEIVCSDDLRSDLETLRNHGYQVVCSVLDDEAIPLRNFSPNAGTVLLLGNEGQGVSAELAASCDHKITIPMEVGIDSLNVVVASGILLYQMKKLQVIKKGRQECLPHQ